MVKISDDVDYISYESAGLWVITEKSMDILENEGPKEAMIRKPINDKNLVPNFGSSDEKSK